MYTQINDREEERLRLDFEEREGVSSTQKSWYGAVKGR